MIWRPVIYGVATYSEIINDWDLDDLLDCHQAINLDIAIKSISDKGKGNR